MAVTTQFVHQRARGSTVVISVALLVANYFQEGTTAIAACPTQPHLENSAQSQLAIQKSRLSRTTDYQQAQAAVCSSAKELPIL